MNVGNIPEVRGDVQKNWDSIFCGRVSFRLVPISYPAALKRRSHIFEVAIINLKSSYFEFWHPRLSLRRFNKRLRKRKLGRLCTFAVNFGITKSEVLDFLPFSNFQGFFFPTLHFYYSGFKLWVVNQTWTSWKASTGGRNGFNDASKEFLGFCQAHVWVL